MFRWSFLILQMIIMTTKTANGSGQCSEAYAEYKCKVEDISDVSDYSQRGVDESYGLCLVAYGFVAVLDNPSKRDFFCVGAIISSRWVLDNCIESPSFKYQRIKIGVMLHPQNVKEYRIERTIQHADYKRFGFTKPKYNNKNYLFAASNALFLRQTATDMQFPKGTCPIRLFKSKKIPEAGVYTIYLNATVMRSLVMRIIPNSCCNHYFRNYFVPGERMCLSGKQYCVSSGKRMTPDDCCRSQAVTIHNHRLFGVMAWSTGCSDMEGIDPWVFSSVSHYLPWIREKTGLNFN